MPVSDQETYINNLIAAVNESARTARNSGSLLLITALYLAVVVLATDDETLLREGATEFAQIGVKFPVVSSYALVPIVFLFFHARTLIQFDFTAIKLCKLEDELRAAGIVKADKDRIRALLIGAPFLQALAAPPRSLERSTLVRFMSWMTVAAVPVLVLFVTQLSFVRYQSEVITGIHQLVLVSDIALLGWFYFRMRRAGLGVSRFNLRAYVPKITAPLSFALVMGFLVVVISLRYASVPSANTTTVGKKAYEAAHERLDQESLRALKAIKKDLDEESVKSVRAWARVREVATLILEQPVDYGLCWQAGLVCRYLRLANRDLLASETRPDVLAKLGRYAIKEDVLQTALDQISGLFLRDRNLRFADFSESRLYKADLIGVDLRGASLDDASVQGAQLSLAKLQDADLTDVRLQDANLTEAQLQGAGMWFSKLQGVDLTKAQLQGADLSTAQLQGADLHSAQLQNAELWSAELQGADLSEAQLQGASLGEAQFQGAYLGYAQLQGADLTKAQLQGASLNGANLQGADLTKAQLQGADLFHAQLQGADLTEAQLQGADLEDADFRGAALFYTHLWQSKFDSSTNIGFNDLRYIYWRPVPEKYLVSLVRKIEMTVPNNDLRATGAIDRVRKGLTPTGTDATVELAKVAGPILVGALYDGRLAAIAERTADVSAYYTALQHFLIELVCSDVHIVRMMVWRLSVDRNDSDGENSDADSALIEWQKKLSPGLAAGLLAEDCWHADKLPDEDKEWLKEIATESKASSEAVTHKTRAD